MAFNLTELLLYIGSIPLLAVAGFSVIDSEIDSPVRMQLGSVTRTCLRRIHDDLISASRTAEDRNGNRVLDPGEDTNANGRLDSDWIIGSTLTFNRSTAYGTWSPPVSYRWIDGELTRTETDITGTMTTETLARDVTEFRVTDDDGVVTVRVTVGTSTSDGRTLTRSGSIEVRLRH